MNHEAATVELLKRKRSRESLHSYALNIDIPMAPMDAMCPDEDVIGPARELMALHHAVILDAVERTMNKPFGRLMVFAPPGSAKSSYIPVVGATWEMGRKPRSRIILTSYADKIAKKQSRRAIQICRSKKFSNIFEASIDRDAAEDWSLTNESEYMAAGIQGGITGNRASGAIVDDPVSGREDADSPIIQEKTLAGYDDDLMTRLLPGAWVILIMTRWNQADLAGEILPENYAGESGIIKCRDGMDWEVINIPAKCERADDPLGREIGEYLWTDWFPPKHWQVYENSNTREGRRRWSSLYQQRPTPEGGGDFTRDMFNWYKPGEAPPREALGVYGASDFAVTEGGGDFTEHGIWGLDASNNLWALDWWSKQADPDEAIEQFLNLVIQWRPNMWFNEGGVIDKSMRPGINRRMRERSLAGDRCFVDLRALPSMQDKRAKCQSFRARASSRSVWLPDLAWAHDLVDQLVALPAGRYDDKADVAGLIGRAIDQFRDVRPKEPDQPRGIKPFTAAWLEWEEPKQTGLRYR